MYATVLTTTAVKTSSLLPSATRPCENDSDGNYSQPTHSKATLVSRTVFSMEFWNSQATSNTARLNEVIISDHIPRNIPEHTLNTTQLSAPSDSPSASEASLTRRRPRQPKDPLPYHHQTHYHPHRPLRRKKSIDFPSLDILPPARLYGDDQQLSSSNVSFAKDECYRKLMPAVCFCAVRSLMGRGLLLLLGQLCGGYEVTGHVALAFKCKENA